MPIAPTFRVPPLPRRARALPVRRHAVRPDRARSCSAIRRRRAGSRPRSPARAAARRPPRPRTCTRSGCSTRRMHLAVAPLPRDVRPARLARRARLVRRAARARRARGDAAARSARTSRRSSCYRGSRPTARAWLAGETAGVPHRAVALEELMMLWLGNANPACAPLPRTVRRPRRWRATPPTRSVTATAARVLRDAPALRPRGRATCVDFLRAPMRAAPGFAVRAARFRARALGVAAGRPAHAAAGGARRAARGGALVRVARARAAAGGAAPLRRRLRARARCRATARGDVEYERFSADEEWMPRCVLLAKSTHVWLDQLAREYGRASHAASTRCPTRSSTGSRRSASRACG